MEKIKQQKVGKVVSTQMASTVVVSVDGFIRHPLYGKKIRRTKRFLAHDPEGKAELGSTVVIEESRPMSKRKHWQVIDIKEKAESTDSADAAIAQEEAVILGTKQEDQ